PVRGLHARVSSASTAPIPAPTPQREAREPPGSPVVPPPVVEVPLLAPLVVLPLVAVPVEAVVPVVVPMPVVEPPVAVAVPVVVPLAPTDLRSACSGQPGLAPLPA